MNFFRFHLRTILPIALAGALLVPASATLSAKSGKVDFSRLVVVGDSLSAGFQDFSLYDNLSASALPAGGQRYGFASIIANQAGTSLTLPLISYPGVPPALVLTPTGLMRLSGAGQRENPTEQVTNLSIPGYSLADALAHPFPGNPQFNAIDALADMTFGAPGTTPGCGPIPTGPNTLIVSEIVCAQALQPTTILVSLGNNDALQAITFGLPPTSTQDFAAAYAAVLQQLTSTGATVVVSNIPDVAVLPILVPVPAFVARCGFMPQGATDADFVVPNITNPFNNDLNICNNYAIRSAALIQQTHDAVVAYNAIIAQLADQYGVTVVDINAALNRIMTKGQVVGGVRLTTAYLGGLFSLDGVHPTNLGYAILANEWIKTMNKELHTGIPPVSLEQVAKEDPLFPAKTNASSH